MAKYYLGAHINKVDNSLIKTIEVIKQNNGNALQLFASNPRSISSPNIESYKAISSEIQKYCQQNDFKLIIHSSYTVNLAKKPSNGKRTIDLKDCYWIKLLIDELIASDIIGSIGVIVHVGKYTTETYEKGLEFMYKAIKYIITQMEASNIKSKLIIETPAGAGTELLNNIDEFIQFYNNFSDEEKKYLGICVDTAHIWSSGYDINEYYNIIAKKNMKDIMVVHFNNSKKNKGSHVDTHDTIFDGKIPLDNLKDFIIKLNISKNKHVPLIILEKPSAKLDKEFEWINNLI